MKFKNDNEESVKYRLGSRKSGYDWYTVKPGETVDIPEHLGFNLTKIEEVQDHVEAKPKAEDPKDVDAGFQEDPEAEAKYKKKLIDIKGVGKKSAFEIMEDYPTEEELKAAILAGKEIHKHDGIDYAVKETFTD